MEDAVLSQLQREGLDDYLAEEEAEHGLVDPAAVAGRNSAAARHDTRRTDAAPLDGQGS